jgi:hypothetical protein
MRERDMRLRVERFIQTRLRSMLMPATLGLGMALSGCDGDGLSANDAGDPTVHQDAANTDAGSPPPVPMYIAAIPDASPELPIGAPEYIAPIVKEDAAGIAVRYMAQMPPDAGKDPGLPIAMYIAQVP